MKEKMVFEKAQKSLIFGTSAAGRYHSILGQPLYLKKANGSKLTSLDGKEYIDYNNSAGASFFGYNHPRIRKAVERSLDMGFFMNFESEYHYQLADKLCSVVPCAEKVRLSNTGTEVTLGAIRLSRSFTKKNIIIKFEGHFHGMHEMIFFNHGKIADVSEENIIKTESDSDGFPESLKDLVKIAEFNNLESVENLLNKYTGQIAAIIVEPVSFNCGCMPARKDFLQGLREICSREGIVLIFDEVLSGFRPSIGGCQEYYGVTPDLTTLAKAMGGGFPIAALVGKKEIMEKLNPGGSTVMSGTYTGSLMPVLVALECLSMMEEPKLYIDLNRISQMLYDGINKLMKDNGVKGHLRGLGNRFAIYFGIENPQDDYSFRKITSTFNDALYFDFLREALHDGLYFHVEGWSGRGVPLPTHCGLTTQHTETDVMVTLEKIEKIFKKIKK